MTYWRRLGITQTAWHGRVLLALVLPSLAAVAFGAPGVLSAGIASVWYSVRGEEAEAQVRPRAYEPVLNAQTMPLLHAARHPDPNPAKGGGEIQIEDGEALRAEAGPLGTLADVAEERHSPDQISLYVVREGDTLSQIAEMFEVSPNTIRWANNINSDESIREGQELVILPVTGVRHTVEEGDTLADIAEQYHADINEIRQFNGLSDEVTLAVGDEITIPGGELAAPAHAESESAPAPVKGTGAPALAGYYAHPLPGGVRTQGLHGYNGVDLGASHGAAVRAAAGGTVIVSRGAGWNGGYGNYVVVDHPNGTQTLYAHLSGNAVWQGATVVAGEVVGYVGSTGRSTGPHLHFEVRGAKNPF